ncbi:MAG: (d)CMP kinase [Thermodesulfobacteriota bacterium]
MGDGRRIVTIDGPSGAGKSTLARLLAASLGWTYLDTGAMYRAVALLVHEAGVEASDETALASLLEGLELEVAPGDGVMRVFLSGREVTSLIREPHISSLASKVSALGVVRRAMVKLQRRLGRAGEIVAEGRDMGTVVFPGAAVKFFLAADSAERSRRRFNELRVMGREVTFEQVAGDLAARDRDDSSRDLAPLRPAEDALTVDTTNLGIDEVLARLLEVVVERLGLDPAKINRQIWK